MGVRRGVLKTGARGETVEYLETNGQCVEEEETSVEILMICTNGRVGPGRGRAYWADEDGNRKEAVVKNVDFETSKTLIVTLEGQHDIAAGTEMKVRHER